MLERVRRIHLVGIGGIGMSGIAEVLANRGYVVSGSDLRRSPITDRLASLGVRIVEGHAAQHVGDAELLIFSSAVGAENAELAEARQRAIPVVGRGAMLAELMHAQEGIAVVGAHGKTTTASMIALVLERGGLDPTAVIGGRFGVFGSNARSGRGRFMVVEADESDRSFLQLRPQIAVITNIDVEHVEQYRDFDDLRSAFLEFANHTAPGGCVVACLDDLFVRALVPQTTRRVLTYGLDSSEADVAAEAIVLGPTGSRCSIRIRLLSGPPSVLQLAVPGRHNLQNALAAVAVGLEVGLPIDRVVEALVGFEGVDRRFQLKGRAKGVTVVDDYGHHPTEIEAVIQAARLQPHGRLVVVFQPHRYTRTIRLLDQFGSALGRADVVIVTDVYAASEAPIAGATAEAVAGAIRRVSSAPVHVVEALDEVPAAVAALARAGDLVVTLGAGSIGRAGEEILRALERGATRPARPAAGRRGSSSEPDR